MKVIVSHEHRFAYFVVPKVASTSIKTALVPVFGLDGDGYWHEDKRGWRSLRVHKLFRDSGHQHYARQVAEMWPEPLSDYFTFAFVRNPWDRIASLWYQKLHNPHVEEVELRQPRTVPTRFRQGMSFEEFVQATAEVPDEDADPHFRSQYLELSAPWDRSVMLPTFVGRFERLETDFAHVTTTLGFNGHVQLPHMMRGTFRSRSYAEDYTPRLREIVGERYADDIRHFGYEF